MRPADPHDLSPASLASAERFDRVWNATRPAEPTPDLLDTLWAQAAAELDRIEAARRSGDHGGIRPIGGRRARPRWVMATLVLAQAAALLGAATFALTLRGGESAQPVTIAQVHSPVAVRAPQAPVGAPVVKPMVVVGFDQTLVIRIDEDGQRVDLLDQGPMLPSMADNTAHDFFNALEIAATP